MATVIKINLNGTIKQVQEDVSYPTPDPSIPQSVTRRQARRALLQAGLLNQVISAIDAVEDETTREAMRIDWEDATDFSRDNHTLAVLASALGLDDAALDQLFVQASQFK